MEKYKRILCQASWTAFYRQLQDAIFFTRAEVYPVDMTDSSYLKLHLSWKNFNREWFEMEFYVPFDEDFPEEFKKVTSCINSILVQASYEDCTCLASIVDMYHCY